MNKLAIFFRESMVARFLIPLGVILIIFSIYAFISVDHSKNFIKTDAIVSKTQLYENAYTDNDGNYIQATYTVYVRYTANGREYEQEYGIFSEYKEGDKLTIAYNPENPREIVQPNTLILPIIILSAGIISLVCGIFSAVKSIKKYKALKLQEEGWKNGK